MGAALLVAAQRLGLVACSKRSWWLARDGCTAPLLRLAGVVTDGSRVCVAFLVWHQVMLGVMVPLFFQAFTRRTYLLPPPPPPPPHAALPALRPAGWRRALAAWQRAWRGADAALTELCTGVGYEGHQLALAAWMLLGNVWLLCVAAATRIVLAEDPA